jgi:GNAT superfamily N-acetyltransferase
MTKNFIIERANPENSRAIASMVGDLLNEIMQGIGNNAFNFNLEETTKRLKEFLEREKYFVFIAWGVNDHKEIGFISLSESYALYAEGAIGTIPELFVSPNYRSNKIGKRLLETANEFGVIRGWKRLEVTSPPLPQFEKSLKFYEKNGFSITGGRKLKRELGDTYITTPST